MSSGSAERIEVVEGDITDQPVEVIVNAWNRNVVPWWLLIPQGVSAAIKRKAGYAPFQALTRMGPIPLGEARLTTAGKLPYAGIIHVAGISLWWRSSEGSVRRSVESALRLAESQGFRSIAFPLIGAGTGGGGEDRVLELMLDELRNQAFDGTVRVVRFRRTV